MSPIFAIPGPATFPARLRLLAILTLALAGVQFIGVHVSATGPQSVSTTSSGDRRPCESWVWHHFGQNPPPAALTPGPAEWRHFGDDRVVPLQSSRQPLLGAQGLARIHELELQMLEMVNRDRADPANAVETKRRAKPLHWNPTLAAVARAHSFDMLNHGYFDHEDGQGRNVRERVESAGLSWKVVGENIAIDRKVASAEAAFMNEPHSAQNHRGNILNATFTEVGIGIAEAPNGALYITQDFYWPRIFH